MVDKTKNATNQKTSLAPMLSVRRGKQALEFYKAAFGARELFLIEDPNGRVVAQLAVGEADFWVADESPENKNFSPETLGGGTVRMVMVVDDPDAAFARAVAAGANVVWPVDNQYGWRLGRVADPFGHHWEIGKPLSQGARAAAGKVRRRVVNRQVRATKPDTAL
jgi:PhnB protein